MLHLQTLIATNPRHQHSIHRNTPSTLLFAVLLAGIGLFAITPAALAHHPLGGRLPANLLEGLMSGLAHPIIGIDHFVFVMAAGLLAAFSSADEKKMEENLLKGILVIHCFC